MGLALHALKYNFWCEHRKQKKVQSELSWQTAPNIHLAIRKPHSNSPHSDCALSDYHGWLRVPEESALNHHSKFCSKTSSNSPLDISWQVQPYDVEGKFSYAYDCVGFFTIPILMGLVTTGVFLVILFLGALALLSITTMDRFDDPKSAAISMGNIQEWAWQKLRKFAPQIE